MVVGGNGALRVATLGKALFAKERADEGFPSLYVSRSCDAAITVPSSHEPASRPWAVGDCS